MGSVDQAFAKQTSGDFTRSPETTHAKFFILDGVTPVVVEYRDRKNGRDNAEYPNVYAAHKLSSSSGRLNWQIDNHLARRSMVHGDGCSFLDFTNSASIYSAMYKNGEVSSEQDFPDVTGKFSDRAVSTHAKFFASGGRPVIIEYVDNSPGQRAQIHAVHSAVVNGSDLGWETQRGRNIDRAYVRAITQTADRLHFINFHHLVKSYYAQNRVAAPLVLFPVATADGT